MNPFPTSIRLALLATCLSTTARADLVEQFVPIPRDCTACTWFQATIGGGAAPLGHSGVMNIGSMPVGPILAGGWMTFTPQGTYVTLFGGGTTTTEVLSPGGTPLTDVRGAAHLASALGVVVDTTTGSTVAVTLYSGEIIWTPTNAYLVLVGGGVTTYDITIGGSSIAGVKGVAKLGAEVVDTSPGIGVSATLFSGAAIYTAGHTYLTVTGGIISTSEILFAGAPIASTRGITAMGGSVAGGFLDSGSFLYTPTKVLLVLTGGVVSVSEVLDPVGGSIATTWGVTRQSPLYGGGGFFAGVATVVTKTRELVVLVGGGVTTGEITTPASASIVSDVSITPSNSLLHQASNLSMMFGSWAPSVESVRGTVIGSSQ